jgi:hypothetical protein
MRLSRFATTALALCVCCLCYGQEQIDPSIPCVRKLGDDPRFSLIAPKLPLGGFDKMTLQMLADQTKPTEVEREQISEYVLAKDECGKVGEQFRRANYPVEVNAALADAIDKGLALMADLYDRKLTYGEANKQTQSIASELRNKIASVIQRMKDEQAARQQTANRQASEERATRAQEAMAAAQQEAVRQQQATAEQQRRQALLQFFLNSYKPIQLPPVRSPTQTNCIRAGNSINCTTY